MIKRFMIVGLLAGLLLALAGVVYSGSEAGKTQEAGKPMHCGMTAEECAKVCGMTLEEFNKACTHQENCSVVKMSIEGMTGDDGAQSVSAALEKVPGVYKVIKVDNEAGTALVCVNAKESSNEALTKAVSDKGYKVEIVPAVVQSTEPAGSVPPGCPPTCPAAKKGCTGKK